jgi:hypothetical protein
MTSRAESSICGATLSRVGLRSLAQVLLGILAFALFVEMWTALANGTVHIGTAAVGAPTLFGVLVADGIALILISVTARGTADHRRPGEEDSAPYRVGCSRCGWATDASTIEEARVLGQQHRYQMHQPQA